MLTVDDIKKPNKLLSVEQQDPMILLAILVWGEARGEDNHGKLAVATVVTNRVALSGKSLKDVILQKYQFSCFNRNDPNYSKLLTAGDDVILWANCYKAAYYAVNCKEDDIVFGATHYITIDLLKSNPPKWIKKMQETIRIGRHVFFKDLHFN